MELKKLEKCPVKKKKKKKKEILKKSAEISLKYVFIHKIFNLITLL